MKIVFMGTPDFAAGALQAIVEAGHEVKAVVTQPDKPKGRGKELQPTPVKIYALSQNIPVFQPSRIKAPEAVEKLKQYQAEVFVVAAFGQLLSREILEMPPYGCLNIHASLLPKYRGAAPIPWAILNGDKVTGITTMQMDEGLDTGGMLLKEEVPIDREETADSLHDKLMSAGGRLIVKTLAMLQAGTLTAQPQEESEATYVGKLEKSFGKIIWTEAALCIERKVRGLNSWPSAYTQRNGKQLKIWKARAVTEAECMTEALIEEDFAQTDCGSIAAVSKDAVFIRTGRDLLQVLSVQPEGKKRMDMRDFLRGYPVKPGEHWG